MLDSINKGKDGGARFALDSVFVSASRQPTDSQEIEDSVPAAFILDELNSLDVDLQGILLRILEQGEIRPLLGLKPVYIRHLIVGIVNENPEEITRETEVREFLRDKGRFGSILSGLFYELIRRTRRLRDDLYHRLRRNLYVEIPDLDNRREDIPILFYVSVPDPHKDPIIELSAYKLLMNPRIQWTGNIRQIQAVAKIASRYAEDDYLSWISEDCVREALETEFPYLSPPRSAALPHKTRARP